VEAIATLMQPEAGLYGRQSVVLQIEVGMQCIRDTYPQSEETEGLLKTLQDLKRDLGIGMGLRSRT
jgi:hypothetical protein